MQIDFHHAVTYVVCRMSGMDQAKARIVAHAAQYVDDATSHGTVRFSNKAIYERISSAHNMLDARNVVAVKNRSVWTPFHFLPGNGGLPFGQVPEGGFINRLVCKPNSYVAQDMVRSAIEGAKAPYGLHRLGITLHVYADTWAHQNFAGVLNMVNEVENIEVQLENGEWKGAGLGQDLLDDMIPPLGHGRANTYPDRPFIKWRYKNGRDELITRDNTELFCEAANEMSKVVKRFMAENPELEADGLSEEDLDAIRSCFKELTFDDGEERHGKWIEAIGAGRFSFGAEPVEYAGRGKTSWKHEALGSSFDESVYIWKDEFMESNWKNFHDAVHVHKLEVLKNILPKYGICAA